jgi:hypothetical protein
MIDKLNRGEDLTAEEEAIYMKEGLGWSEDTIRFIKALSENKDPNRKID